ncbi:MAG: hypothetical protein IH585_19120 [Anaerolineaceae bacterium]|nr:hypothetical protein [Anaerolineaceae bacterium]
MSNAPESVPFVRRVLQTLAPTPSAGVSQTDERWSRSTLWVFSYPARSDS